MKISTAAVLVLGAVVAACDQRATEQSEAADLAAIEAVNARTLAALNAGDWARLNELTDDDYVASSLAGTYKHIYQRKPDGTWALTRAMAETAAE